MISRICERTQCCLWTLAGVAVLASAACADDSSPFQHRQALDAIGTSATAAGVVGLSIAVTEGGEVVFAQSYGQANRATGDSLALTHRFNIASTAKLIAAAAVMKLVDEGRIDLEDTLATLLPSFPNTEQARRITLRQMLNMTSGLNDYLAADLERLRTSDAPLPPGFVIDHLRDRPLDFEPGSNWIYSNSGFYLAGLIVERVAGQPWGTYVTKEVLGPLGLAETTLCDDVVDARTVGYEWSGDELLLSALDAERGVRGDAGLCATIGDLARLPNALLSGRLLGPENLEAMLEPTSLSSRVSVDYGLGVMQGQFAGRRLWGHLGGAGSSYVSALGHFPDADLSVAVLINTRSASTGALQIFGDVARVVLAVDLELEDQPVGPELGRSVAGLYEGDRSRTRRQMEYDEGRVIRTSPGDPASQLVLLHQGQAVFGRADWPADRFAFHMPDGTAVAYSVYYNGFFDGFYTRIDESVTRSSGTTLP